jgi:hypothetical protein
MTRLVKRGQNLRLRQVLSSDPLLVSYVALDQLFHSLELNVFLFKNMRNIMGAVPNAI